MDAGECEEVGSQTNKRPTVTCVVHCDWQATGAEILVKDSEVFRLVILQEGARDCVGYPEGQSWRRLTERCDSGTRSRTDLPSGGLGRDELASWAVPVRDDVRRFARRLSRVPATISCGGCPIGNAAMGPGRETGQKARDAAGARWMDTSVICCDLARTERKCLCFLESLRAERALVWLHRRAAAGNKTAAQRS